MSINVGLFTLIVCLVFALVAYKFFKMSLNSEPMSDRAFFTGFSSFMFIIATVVFLILSLVFISSKDEKYMVDFNHIVQFRSNDTDARIKDLEKKYQDLLNTKIGLDK